LITKKGTLEILIWLNYTTSTLRHKQISQAIKGYSARTLSIRLRELEENSIIERRRYNEMPPKVEYRLTNKGQQLAEYIISVLQWMRKWSSKISDKYDNE
jgi:DNA-binding HxlR family transcriptional regulator